MCQSNMSLGFYCGAFEISLCFCPHLVDSRYLRGDSNHGLANSAFSVSRTTIGTAVHLCAGERQDGVLRPPMAFAIATKFNLARCGSSTFTSRP